jgi:hypothetical protein
MARKKTSERHGNWRDPDERFWSKVDKSAPNNCWVWTAALIRNGYGGFALEHRKTIPAHRHSWNIHFGELARDGSSCVCHRCDNRRCVNPDHLFLGTHGDNARDRTEKGRGARGEKMFAAKLTEDAVREIRRKWAAGEATQTQMGREYGVSQVIISSVVRRKTWKHVP